jgi:glucan phosphoethanolaminetransferase (alkaline phosphatase superfamily)
MTEMAISGYLGWFFLLLISYPFALVVINIVYYEPVRKKATFWFNIICLLLATFLLVMHMNIEIIYGKELLDAWYSANPDE